VKARAVVALLALAAASGIAAPASAQAQTGSVTGVVTDRATGSPMQGVAITVVGTRLAQTTNESGRFLFPSVPAGAQRLTAQYLGYSDQTVEVTVVAGQAATASIALETTVLALQEVIVTGVSEATQGTRAPFTVGRVSRENIATVPTTNSAVAAIQGKVAGAQIVRGSGQPGTGVSVLLRSPTSIQGGNGPMYVVDGVILNTGINGTTVDLESLDIESIEVVKGAAAASLYGSRAASGVISITTNRGRSLALDQTRITGRMEFGTSQAPKGISLLQAHPFLQNAQGQWVDAQGNVVTRTNRVLTPTNMMDQDFRTPLYDNVSAFFRPAQFMQSSVNLSHRAANTNFLVSAVQYNERGTLETNEGFVRNNFRVNLDHRLRSDFALQLSAAHSRYDRDLLYGGTDGVFWDLLMYPTDMNLGRRGPDGQFLQQPDSSANLQNPLWYESSREFWEKRARTIASVNARYNPFNWVTVIGDLAYDRSDAHVHAYTPKGVSVSLTSDAESNGFLRKENDRGDVMNASVQANITRNFGEFTTRTVGRALMERQYNEFYRADGTNFHVVDVPRLNVAADRTVQSSIDEIRSTGYFLEQNVDYAGRYNITALARRDGSSLFGENERWQNYYRVGAAWIMSEEPWWNFESLTLFKPRYSIGTAGGRPGFSAQYETWTVSNTGAVSKATLGNRNLRPEHTTEQEMGVDMIFNDRYSLQLTYAKQTTRDQIIQLVLPAMFGYPSQWYNTGVQSGNTYEATLEAQLVNRGGFQWSTTFVADRSRSTMDEWNRSCFISGLRNVCEGASLADMWGERFLTDLSDIQSRHPGAGNQFQVNDDGYVVWVGEGASWRDGLSQELWGTQSLVDGELYRWGMPILDRDTMGFTVLQQIGSSAPDANLGWLNNIYWRGFAIHSHMQAQIGGNTYNGTKQRLYQHERSGDLDQRHKPLENRKTLNYYEALYNRNNPSSHFVEDGAYLKLRALSVMYRFNQDQLNRFGVGRLARSLNLGVNARNIFTLSNYSGFDPEVGSVLQRRDLFSYPNARQFTFTGEITF
jgi:TonB-linked SusC/RagA family outer membrane protein